MVKVGQQTDTLWGFEDLNPKQRLPLKYMKRPDEPILCIGLGLLVGAAPAYDLHRHSVIRPLAGYSLLIIPKPASQHCLALNHSSKSIFQPSGINPAVKITQNRQVILCGIRELH